MDCYDCDRWPARWIQKRCYRIRCRHAVPLELPVTSLVHEDQRTLDLWQAQSLRITFGHIAFSVHAQ